MQFDTGLSKMPGITLLTTEQLHNVYINSSEDLVYIIAIYYLLPLVITLLGRAILIKVAVIAPTPEALSVFAGIAFMQI